MRPIFLKARRFFPSENPCYEQNFPVKGKEEIVSYDSLICKHIDTEYDETFQNLENYFSSEVIDWKVLTPIGGDEQIIAYFLNPREEVRTLDGFEFCGYDLIDNFGISALMDCGYDASGAAFERAVPYERLNRLGRYPRRGSRRSSKIAHGISGGGSRRWTRYLRAVADDKHRKSTH